MINPEEKARIWSSLDENSREQLRQGKITWEQAAEGNIPMGDLELEAAKKGPQGINQASRSLDQQAPLTPVEAPDSGMSTPAALAMKLSGWMDRMQAASVYAAGDIAFSNLPDNNPATQYLKGGLDTFVSDNLAEAQAVDQGVAAQYVGDPSTVGGFARRTVTDVAGSPESVAPIIGSFAGAAGNRIGAALPATSVFLTEYMNARMAGVPREEAAATAGTKAGIEFGVEAMTGRLSGILKFGDEATAIAVKKGLPAAQAWIAKTARTAGAEAGTEALTENAQMALDFAAAKTAIGSDELTSFSESNLPKTTDEWQERTVRSAAAGSVAGGALRGASAPFEIASENRMATAIQEQQAQLKEAQEEFDRNQAALEERTRADAELAKTAEQQRVGDAAAKDSKDLKAINQPGAQIEMPFGSDLAGDPLQNDRTPTSVDMFTGQALPATKVEERRAANELEAAAVADGKDPTLTDEEFEVRSQRTSTARNKIDAKQQKSFEERKADELAKRQAIKDAEATLTQERLILSSASIKREVDAKLAEEVEKISNRPFNKTPQGQRGLATVVAKYIEGRKPVLEEQVRDARIARVNGAKDLLIAEDNRQLDQEVEEQLKFEDEQQAKELERTKEAEKPEGTQGTLALAEPKKITPAQGELDLSTMADESLRPQKGEAKSSAPVTDDTPTPEEVDTSSKELADILRETQDKEQSLAHSKWVKADAKAKKDSLVEARKATPEGTNDQIVAKAQVLYSAWKKSNPEPVKPKEAPVTREKIASEKQKIESREKAKVTRKVNKTVQQMLKEGKTEEEILEVYQRERPDEPLPDELQQAARDKIGTLVTNSPLRSDGAVAKGMTKEATQRVVESMTANWPSPPKVVYVEKASDIPGNREDSPTFVDGKGFHANGTIYIVHGSIPNEDKLRQVFTHEAIGHYGLELILTKNQWQDIYRSVMNDPAYKDLRKTLEDRGYDMSDPVEVGKEAMARLAELSTKDSLWDKFVSYFMAGLRRLMPGSTINLTQPELRALVAKAARNLESGKITDLPSNRRMSAFNEPALEEGQRAKDKKELSPARKFANYLGDVFTNGNYSEAVYTEMLGRINSVSAAYLQQAIQTEKRIESTLRDMASEAKRPYSELKKAFDTAVDTIEDAETQEAKARAIETFNAKFGEAAKGYHENRIQIDNFTNELISLRLDKDPRPLTGREVAIFTSLKKNLGAYYHRAYILHQGQKGREYAKLVKKQHARVANKGSQDAIDIHGYETIEGAIDFIQSAFTVIPESEKLYDMNLDQLKALAEFWKINTDSDKDRDDKIDDLIDALENKREEIDATEGMSRARAKQLALEILKNDEGSAIVKYYRAASQDRGVYKQKSAVPLAIRRLMGEIEENPIKALMTLTKQANLLARTAGLLEIKNHGMSVGDVITGEEYATGEYDPKEWELMAGESFGPLAKHYARKALFARLKDVKTIEATWDDVLEASRTGSGRELAQKAGNAAVLTAMKGGALYKKAMLMYNPVNVVFNFGGGPITVVANGGGGLLHLKQALDVARQLIKSELTYHKSPELTEIIRAGITDSALMGSIRAQDRDKLGEALSAFQAEGGLAAWKEKLQKAGQWNKAYQEVYAMADVVWKIANYYDRKDTLTKFHKANGTDITQERIERDAAQDTRVSNFSFSMVPSAVRLVEKVPILYIAPYTYEVFRSIIGSFILGMKDIKVASEAKTPEARDIMLRAGARRLVGSTSVMSGIFQTALYAAALAFGPPEDKDDELRGAFSNLVAAFKKYSTFGYAGKDKDGFDVLFDISRFDPYGPLSEFSIMAMKGATADEYLEKFKKLAIGNPGSTSLWRMVDSMLNSGEDSPVNGIAFRNAKVPDIVPLIGGHPTGERIYEAVTAVGGPPLAEFINALTPTWPKRLLDASAPDLSEAAINIRALVFLGAKFDRVHVPTSVDFAVREFKETRDEQRTLIEQGIRDSSLSKEDAWKLILDAEKVEREAYKRLYDIYQSSTVVGYTPQAVVGMMRAPQNKMSVTDLQYLISGAYDQAPTSAVSMDSLTGLQQRMQLAARRESPATEALQQKNFRTLVEVLKEKNYPIRR